MRRDFDAGPLAIDRHTLSCIDELQVFVKFEPYRIIQLLRNGANTLRVTSAIPMLAVTMRHTRVAVWLT